MNNQETEEYKHCPHEHKITKHLYVCRSKERCEFQKRYDSNPLSTYCKRAKMLETALHFVHKKEDLEGRTEHGDKK